MPSLMNLSSNSLSEKIIGVAIDVHGELGPGLLESTYEACLAYELNTKNIKFERQVSIPINYKNSVIHENAYRIDFLVEKEIIIEVKAVEMLVKVHESQLLTYMRLSKIHVGLLINFNVPLLRNGIKRKLM